ncbi:RNA polymerase sigma factor [Carboxylicivirga caseinilyticus]|uniref:RNA polymerase sigma factor n=1 Tax=Carboxylicivirga caseinilyticus TaxID=3417572 RepID=UPI003D34D12D|nr:RNA polymerase sigma factor [Marinilabiliaceae bacterium A049]
MSNNKDIELIKSIKKGDVAAFSQIIDMYQHMAFTLAKGIVKNLQEAEEVTQDAFVKAYKSLDSFKGDASFSTWLYRIVYNTAISKLRSRKPSTEDLESKETIQYEANYAENNMHRLELQERKKVLKKALSNLKEDDAFILILYYYKEQSIEEISKTTGLSVSNIKVKLHRGRKQMQTELNAILKGELNSIL